MNDADGHDPFLPPPTLAPFPFREFEAWARAYDDAGRRADGVKDLDAECAPVLAEAARACAPRHLMPAVHKSGYAGKKFVAAKFSLEWGSAPSGEGLWWADGYLAPHDERWT